MSTRAGSPCLGRLLHPRRGAAGAAAVMHRSHQTRRRRVECATTASKSEARMLKLVIAGPSQHRCVCSSLRSTCGAELRPLLRQRGRPRHRQAPQQRCRLTRLRLRHRRFQRSRRRPSRQHCWAATATATCAYQQTSSQLRCSLVKTNTSLLSRQHSPTPVERCLSSLGYASPVR